MVCGAVRRVPARPWWLSVYLHATQQVSHMLIGAGIPTPPSISCAAWTCAPRRGADMPAVSDVLGNHVAEGPANMAPERKASG